MANNLSGAAPHRRRIIVVGIAFAILAAAGIYRYWAPSSEPARVAPPAGRTAVPVSVAVATRQDVPIYVTGLGTVQASFTIAIHSQVDGIMQEVLFTEGQHVKKGDVLARIDPRLLWNAACLAPPTNGARSTSQQTRIRPHLGARRDTSRGTTGSAAPACERRRRPSPIGQRYIACRPPQRTPARH